MMINLLRPKYFVPIHGEYRHLVLHSKLAQQCGVNPDRIFVMETGDVLSLGAEGAEIVDSVAEDYVFVDGRGVGDVGQGVLDDRRSLSRNGFLVASVVLDKYTGSLSEEPQIATRGFISDGETAELMDRLKREISKEVQRGGTRSEIAERLKTCLTRLTFEETGRHPMIIPIVTKA